MSRREALKWGREWLACWVSFEGWSFHGTWNIIIAFLIHQFRK
jgi:hypothetical protein